MTRAFSLSLLLFFYYPFDLLGFQSNELFSVFFNATEE